MMNEWIFRLSFLGFILLVTYVLSWHVIVGLVLGMGIGGAVYEVNRDRIMGLKTTVSYMWQQRGK